MRMLSVYMDISLFLSQGSAHPFTDLLNLNSAPSAGASLLVDVLSDGFSPASPDVSEENFSRWGSYFELRLARTCARKCGVIYIK